MDLQFKIVYKQGSTNIAADALSRQPATKTVCVVSSAYFEWLDRIKAGYQDDPQAVKLLTAHQASEPLVNGFSISDGLIRQHGRLWLGRNSGFLPTYHRIRQLFIWPKMKDDIQNYVRSYSVCQQAKVEHTKLPGLLQPLPILDQA